VKVLSTLRERRYNITDPRRYNTVQRMPQCSGVLCPHRMWFCRWGQRQLQSAFTAAQRRGYNCSRLAQSRRF